ncbi:GNAT family N-acetyltransferase [Sediminitomix flava]|uniref:Aminoglycoside 6'-N-acetyltransferase I n=1 Tax=Sediminitomix flava TaxID=379075 RepID=A0A315Z9H8_SEDFL|nr:GNAT family N-acetyltransferase [Sediminitomix flava]PWJ41079.1 aminoglycoside 6'-N-acetyltransferase I [Sediminitomix flava]
MSKQNLHIELLEDLSEAPFELLELADPSREQIMSYLKTGHCYVAILASEVVGVLVLTKIDQTSTEIKNIAVSESAQGKGFGKVLLRYATNICQTKGDHKLIIGTGNSSIGQLALYQKEGFEIKNIKKNFFLDNYDEPIFENGIQCKHMIVLEKDLRK